MADNLDKYFEYIEQNRAYLIDQLREIVVIPSVSAEAAKRSEVIRMGEWLKERMEGLGVKVKMADLGSQELEGKSVPLPPVVLGKFGEDPNKKTITIYGHYDVQPAYLSDGWDTEPFTLVETEDGRLVGRGSTDDKGPVIGWLLCLEAHQKLGIEIPVNLNFCFEGMEESSSVGLVEMVEQEAENWFKGTDFTCICDNFWLGTTKPGLTYGLRGMNYFQLEVSGPAADLHSGVFGGVVYEPMTALVKVMSNLVDVNGKILVPGIYDQVAELTAEEENRYEDLSFKNSDVVSDLKADCLLHDTEADTLKSRWRYPSLTLHGIEGAFYSPGAKTVIPAKVIGKFSIRTVPNMDGDEVTRLVTKYVNEQFASLGTKCKVNIQCGEPGRWWYASPNHPNYVAGSRAMKRVFNVEPELIREGGSIPITITFEEALKKNVILLSMGSANDGAHSTNEKINVFNYVNGIKMFGAYWQEIANL